MQVKWWVPVLVGSALFSACGDGSTASSTTAVNLSSTAFATLAPTETTAVVVTTIAGEGSVSVAEQEYTVVSGDYLFGIASRFGVTADAIVLANGWVDGISHPLSPGDKIKIPSGAIVPAPVTTAVPGAVTTTAAPASTDTTAVAPDSNGCTPGTHEIVAGDLPGNVATKYDVTVAQLDAANVNTTGYTNFVVGVKIIIPCP